MGTVRNKTEITKIISEQYQKLTVKSRKKLHINVLKRLVMCIRAHHLQLKENSGGIR